MLLLEGPFIYLPVVSTTFAFFCSFLDCWFFYFCFFSDAAKVPWLQSETRNSVACVHPSLKDGETKRQDRWLCRRCIWWFSVNFQGDELFECRIWGGGIPA